LNLRENKIYVNYFVTRILFPHRFRCWIRCFDYINFFWPIT